MDNKQELILKGIDELEKITEKQRVERHRLDKWQKKLDKTGGFNKFSLKYYHFNKKERKNKNKMQ